MQARLEIDFSKGMVIAEGEEEFVRDVYADFKDQIDAFGNGIAKTNKPPKRTAGKANRKPKRSRTPRSDKPSRQTTDGSNIDVENPKLNKELDTSKLKEFYQQFDPRNNAERILLFSVFLSDELQVQQVNTDQIYTCFSYLKVKIPQAFTQSFRHAQGAKYGYIDFDASGLVKVTTLGRNHFNDGIKRKVEGSE